MYSASGRLSNDDLVTRYTPLVKRIAYHFRITSYNVCYTKLLRREGQRDDRSE